MIAAAGDAIVAVCWSAVEDRSRVEAEQRDDEGSDLATEGTTTTEARKEATRDGAPPIELVDADKLVIMFERASLGLRSKQTFEIDERFFAEFAT